MELDLEFHTLYLAASGNQKAVNVFRDMQPFTYASGTYVSQPHYRDCECVEEHQAILDAALASDLDALKAARLPQHLITPERHCSSSSGKSDDLPRKLKITRTIIHQASPVHVFAPQAYENQKNTM